MHIMRRSSTRYSVALAKVFISNRPFIHKLQFSFRARQYFFQDRVFLQNIKQSSKYATINVPFCRSVAFLPFIVVLSLPSIIQHVFQNIRFLHNMQCVIDIQYCCQKVNGRCILQHSLKQERLLLKEHAAYRLQSALYSFK